jgi:putative ABC transport system permease protein
VFLALKEMKRAKVRFGLLIAALAMLVFLILFQWTLRNGLLNGFTGAIKNQSAPVLVYTVDGQRFLQASIIAPDIEAQIRAVDGVAASGRIGQGTFTASARNDSSTEVSLLGYEVEGLGSPTELIEGRLPLAPGEVVASDVDAAAGFAVGDVVTIQPGAMNLTVVGRAAQIQINVTPTLFGTYDTYEEAVLARNRDAGTPLPNAIALRPAAGVSDGELVKRVNALSEDIDALTRNDAATKAPGVAQVTTSFWIIFALYGVVVPLIAGLFFVIITFQKAGALTLLRAIGAPGSALVKSLMFQVGLVMGLGILVGTALYALLLTVTNGKLGGIAIVYEGTAVTLWSVVLMLFGFASALVAAIRVNRIDPVRATTGAGVGR